MYYIHVQSGNDVTAHTYYFETHREVEAFETALEEWGEDGITWQSERKDTPYA